MQVSEVHVVDGGFQIGGGAGYAAARVRDAQRLAQAALAALAGDGNDIPVIGPHPKEAALAAVREAVLHLNEAISLAAPEDALIDTRHALEELTTIEAQLARGGWGGKPVMSGNPTARSFELAIELLIRAEHWFLTAEQHDPNTPHDMHGNSGIVPPWLR